MGPRYDDELSVWTRFAVAAIESGMFRPSSSWAMSEESYVALAACEVADEMLRFWQQRYDTIHASAEPSSKNEDR